MLNSALVVDNNAVILKLLSHILQQRGLQVRTAVDGLTALEVLDNFQPDIIFTDLVMPYIGGEKLCRIVSRNKTFAKTPLIVVSAIALEENIDVQAFGAHACIAKGPAAEMSANIELVLSLITSGRPDLLKGLRLGAENLVHRAVTGELLAAKHHLQLILENIDNGFIEFSHDEKIIGCNGLLQRLFQKDELSLIGKPLRDLFADESTAHVIECLDIFANADGPVVNSRSVLIRGRDIVFKLLRMSWKEGQSSIMLLRDISEEKQANLQLQRHLGQLEELVAERTRSYETVNQQLQHQIAAREKINEELEFVARQWSKTFDTISDFVSVHDKDMKFVRVNKALASFVGQPPEQLIGQHCYKILHGQDHPWQSCPHLAALAAGHTVTSEVHDDHIGIPLLVTCSPLLHDDGSLLGSVHVARDISEQKKAADEREKLIRRLEDSLNKVQLLRGFIPICASCKKIRDDRGYWQQVEEYIRDHSEAQFSHSICPSCARQLYPDIPFPDE